MSLPYLPLFVDDYEAATAHLTLMEDGIYTRLLRLCWRTPRCRLPADMDWIARKIRIQSDEETAAMKSVISEFFTTRRGFIFSKRLSAEYERICASVQRLSEAGKSGARAKALKNNKIMPSVARATLKHPEPEPYPEEKPVGFSARQSAQKPTKPRSGWVERKTSSQAFNEMISEIDGHDDQRRIEVGSGSSGEPVQLLPASRAG